MTWVAEGGLGAHGVEIDEPGFEQRPRHGLQRFVHAPVQFDLVVQRAQDVGDGALFGERWDSQLPYMGRVAVEARHCAVHIHTPQAEKSESVLLKPDQCGGVAGDEKSRVNRPAWNRRIMNCPYGPFASNNYSWPFR